MTENDYIAEYVKEKYPKLLGFDFGMWKFCRMMNNVIKGIVNVFKSKDTSDYVYDTTDEESEEEECQL